MASSAINKHPIEVKTILRKGKLPDPFFAGKLGFSPYAACQHACRYCDGRAEKYYVEGDFEKDFYVTLKSGESKVIECKNIQVISISTKQKIQAYLHFLITENIILTEDLREHIGLIGVQAAQLSCTDLPGKQNSPSIPICFPDRIARRINFLRTYPWSTFEGLIPSAMMNEAARR